MILGIDAHLFNLFIDFTTIQIMKKEELNEGLISLKKSIEIEFESQENHKTKSIFFVTIISK